MPSKTAPVLFTIARADVVPNSTAIRHHRSWRLEKLSSNMCLVFNRDIVEDGSIFEFLETPPMRYLLRDTNALFLNVSNLRQYVNRYDAPKMASTFQSVLWYNIADADYPTCLESPPSEEMRPYFPNRLVLTTCLALIRRSEQRDSWKINSCNFRQLSTSCKKMQRLISCRACSDFPCYSRLADNWFQSIGYRDDEPNETVWKSWMAVEDENTQPEQKIKYLQDTLGAGHNAHFEFIHPNDTREGPFQSNIRSYTEHNWDGIPETRKARKQAAAAGQETKRLKKELCPACVFSDYCERWSIRSCNGPCTKEHVLAESQYWLQENNIKDADREKLALIASVSDHAISRIFRHKVTIGRMTSHLDQVKTHTRRHRAMQMRSPDDILLLLRADRGHEWLQGQQEWARSHPMSDEALAMYLELCQPARRWIGLGAGYFGAIRSPMAVEYRGDTRFNMVFSSGYDMSFDGFGSLWRLKHEFVLWKHWKELA